MTASMTASMTARACRGSDHQPDRRGRVIPWLFVAAFLVVIAANTVMMVLAISSFSGIATEDSFRRGIGYNMVLETEARQQARGWRVDLRFTPAGDRAGDGAGTMVGPGAQAGGRHGMVALAVTDRDGAALTGATVAARFLRPTRAGTDFDARLAEVGAGRYQVAVDLPLRGVWDVRLTITRGEATHHANRRLVAP